jgi:hypothetical protein
MDKILKSSDSEYYLPMSEPFTFYTGKDFEQNWVIQIAAFWVVSCRRKTVSEKHDAPIFRVEVRGIQAACKVCGHSDSFGSM